MSLEVFRWVMYCAYIFFAIMVLVKFMFYKRKDDARVAVYFWGGLLFLSFAIADCTSYLFYKTDLHFWQDVIFFALAAWTMYTSVKNRRAVGELAVES
ncbi:hypothetical protein [Tumebacillus lipolyticus]|uniref:Uncharacterized protein n=1 Tax=Tumebacillus lipolyticus TaxID=1280370 RepID=A0ABW5A0A4_9BACL